MSQLPPDPPRRNETLLEEPPPPFEPPAHLAALPGYRIRKLLGQGGMADVYLAHNEPMDRPEVLKVVQKALLTRSGALDRFQQEIRNAARLLHPNIVTAYSCLQAGDALVLAMEYVPGQDLAELVKGSGPLPVANAAHYARQAALGLQHAFEKGMVHRDIKPHNLMLHRDGPKHTVKVLDFGLAKVTSEKPVDGALTRAGQMLGTPDYVAPEQTRDAAKADIRSDIYSLGCTLHFLLTGRPPFTGQSLFEILEAHNIKTAPRLDALRPEVPKGLADVVAMMMAKDPAQRYQTPAQVAAALLPFTKAPTKVLTAKPAGPPPVSVSPPPVPGSATTASLASSSGKTPAPSGAVKRPPPVPRGTDPQWDFEDSGPARRPAPAQKSNLGLILVLGFVGIIVLVGGGIAALFAAGVFDRKESAAPVVVNDAPPRDLVENATVPNPDVGSKGSTLVGKSSPKQNTGGPKKSFPKKGRTEDPVPDPKPEPPKVEPPKVEPPKPEPPRVAPKPPVPTLEWWDLFQGQDTRGWEAAGLNGGTWAVDTGELVGKGTSRVTLPAVFVTRKDYTNFVLKFEARAADDAEHRLLVRARAAGGKVRGYALNLSGRRGAAGAFARYDDDPVKCLPSWQQPSTNVPAAVGDWHSWEVTCIGPRVHVKLDKQVVADWEVDGDPNPSGAIGLMASGPTGVRFRKIAVAELPVKPAEAAEITGLKDRAGQVVDVREKMPFGAEFWEKWELVGRTEWEMTEDGRLSLTGGGGLVSRASSPDLALSLSAGADAECWAAIKLTGSGGAYGGPGVRVAGDGTKVSAGQGSTATSGKAEGTVRDFKPGEVFKIEVGIENRLEISGGEAQRIPRLIGRVFSASQVPQETCKVQLENNTPGKVGLLLKKGSVVVKSIDKP